MDSERGGLLKTRAEDFARQLHTRLRTLTSDSNSWVAEEASEVYSDIDSSLVSPEEELVEPLFVPDQTETFPLQRDGSTDSQYFDSVENVEDLSPVTLRKVPAFQLASASKPIVIPNSRRTSLDVSLDSSRVHEVDSFDSQTDTADKENKENNCDIDTFQENNKIKIDSESEESIGLKNSTMSKNIEDTNKMLLGNTNETSEEPCDSFCVFCDIEQIKTSLSMKDGEVDAGKEGLSTSNSQYDEVKCEDNVVELATTPHPPPSLEHNNQCSPDLEKDISLPDLLYVLKQDVIRDQAQSYMSSTNAECISSSDRVCPDIQVHESSPVVTAEAEHTEEDDCDIETRRRNFRRSSSLKSGKTPPGTPGRKKIVRFADVLGLDLADVKTFLDEVPTIPKSAYEDLHGADLSSSPVLESPLARITVAIAKPEKILTPLFQQPSAQPNFLDRVRNNNVCLESAYVSDSAFFAVSGLVRVKNIDFHKSVYVRYSIDKWRSFSDLQARYVPNSCDGFSDKFTFVLYAHTLTAGQRLEFAVRFHSAGAQFWDNNGGGNYVFECINQLPPDPGLHHSPMDGWAGFY